MPHGPVVSRAEHPIALHFEVIYCPVFGARPRMSYIPEGVDEFFFNPSANGGCSVD